MYDDKLFIEKSYKLLNLSEPSSFAFSNFLAYGSPIRIGFTTVEYVELVMLALSSPNETIIYSADNIDSKMFKRNIFMIKNILEKINEFSNLYLLEKPSKAFDLVFSNNCKILFRPINFARSKNIKIGNPKYKVYFRDFFVLKFYINIFSKMKKYFPVDLVHLLDDIRSILFKSIETVREFKGIYIPEDQFKKLFLEVLFF